ncbi:MAG: permease-like cell division protein FtsX [Cellvibrionaceae bacterium]|nr:permease-like cell division protein FtsX [Cellvibrionaceae bacterium]
MNRREPQNRGASNSHLSVLTLARSWWHHHKSSCINSLLRLLDTPLQSLLTWVAIGIALTLPVSLYLGLQTVQALGQGWEDNAQMSVFLVKQAKPKAIDQLRERLLEDDLIHYIDVIKPSHALAEFQQHSGLGDILNKLEDNPLPTVLLVQPEPAIDTPEKLQTLADQLAQLPLVDNVQIDMGWLQRLYELLALGQRIVLALGGVLLISVLLIVGNTLRLAIENRRDEIVVVKMVGGTDGFVRRPFLYTGLWYGVGGGLCAVLMLYAINFWLSNPIENLALLYEGDYALDGLSLSMSLGLTASAGLLGWLGAWLAVARHLRQIQPS